MSSLIYYELITTIAFTTFQSNSKRLLTIINWYIHTTTIYIHLPILTTYSIQIVTLLTLIAHIKYLIITILNFIIFINTLILYIIKDNILVSQTLILLVLLIFITIIYCSLLTTINRTGLSSSWIVIVITFSTFKRRKV